MKNKNGEVEKVEVRFTIFGLQAYLHLYGTYMWVFFIPAEVKYAPFTILREKKSTFLLKFYITAYPLRYDQGEKPLIFFHICQVPGPKGM